MRLSGPAAKLSGAFMKMRRGGKGGKVQDDETGTTDLSKSHKVTFAN